MEFLKEKIIVVFLFFLSLLCFVSSDSFVGLKMLILLLLLVLSFKKLKVNSLEMLLFIFYYIFCFFQVILGFTNSNNIYGIYLNFRAFVIYPTIFYIFVKNIENVVTKIQVLYILDIVNLILIMDMILYILYNQKIIGFYFNFPNGAYGYNGVGKKIYEISTQNMGAYSFFTPYSILRAMNKEKKIKILLYINIIFNVYISLFLGRDILGITVILLSLMILLKKLKKIIYILPLILLNKYTLSYIDKKYDIIIEKLLSSERFLQIKFLWIEFEKKPFLGSGFASSLKYFKRSETQDWAYEMTYNYFLFAFGLVGTLVLLFYIFLPFLILKFKNIKIFNDPVAIGFLFFLFATCSNPYLLKFDYIFLYFYLMLYIKVIY